MTDGLFLYLGTVWTCLVLIIGESKVKPQMCAVKLCHQRAPLRVRSRSRATRNRRALTHQRKASADLPGSSFPVQAMTSGPHRRWSKSSVPLMYACLQAVARRKAECAHNCERWHRL
jgi:hypothetical protein